jgi:3-oxoacyl-[acyl-carrier protein] reductase
MMMMSSESFQRVLDVNLKGAFNCIKLAARPMMKAKSGRIVNISSVVALAGNAAQANYVASKAGLIGLTKAAAQELAPRGITVNAVAPGFIATDMTAALSGEVRGKMLGQIPLGYFGEPEDVAAAAAFLCCDEARYITGQVLSVNGGMYM